MTVPIPFPVCLAVFAIAVNVTRADELALSVKPLPHAHAHNDYLHRQPLRDALEHGFTSVEADIFLVEGQLLVGHDEKELRPDRTLSGLYLDPLRERANANGGWVFDKGRPFTLLIDVKSD